MALALTSTVLTVSTANAQIETFNDGTEVEVTIDSPADGSAPVNGEVELAGTARVGAGDTPPDTSLVVVYDLSTSTLAASGGDCGGDLDSDGTANTILDCEIAAIEALAVTADALGSVAEMGVVLFENSSGAADVNPASGIQRLTAPGADLNNNGQGDISEVVRSTYLASSWFTATARVDKFTRVNAGTSNGGTNYAAGLSRACETLAAASQPNRTIVFLSDGGANQGTNVANVLPCSQPATVYSVAVGAGSTCAFNPAGRGSMQEVADLTGGTCTEVISPEDLPDILSGIISPEIYALGMSVNGGPELDISSTASVPLPAPGPDALDWSLTVPGLNGPTDEICVTVYARRDAELVEATECITVISNRPPVADAGGDQTFVEGSLVGLDGTGSSDPDGDPLTYQWSILSETGAPIVLSSTSDPVASFITFDDGVYNIELAVSDGRVESTDQVTITVTNDAPVASAIAEPASEGGIALITASFTDGGLLDTHTATIDWGDGTPVEDVAISAQGNGWGSLFATHSYGGPGAFTATITVTDDDGGTDTVQSVSVEVSASLALWANSESEARTIRWAGGVGTVEGLVHTNNDLRVRGSAKTIDGPIEYVGSLDTKDTTFTEPATQVSPAPMPIAFDIADYAPGGRAAVDAGTAYNDMSAQCGSRWDPSGPIAPGLYYVPCDVKLNSSALSGTATIVATGDIQVSGSGANFSPFIDGLLFLSASNGDKAIQTSVSDSTFLGYLYAGTGRVDLSGSGNTYLCGILADRIDITDNALTIRASDCVRPRRTVAPPSLVPALDVNVDVNVDVALPGDTVTTTTTLTNNEALLLVPGVVGLENLGGSSVTVAGVSLGLEYLPVGGSWTPIAEPLTIASTPNSSPGVTYAATDFAGTVVDAGGLATWGAEIQVTLPAATVNFLLDANQVVAIRNVFSITLDNPNGEPVRNLFRFGNDFAEELRAIGGDLTDIQAVVTNTDGAAQIVDSTTVPELAVLAPGQTATVTQTATVPVPAERGPGEPVDAYLARLTSLDQTLLSGSAFAISSGGVGTVLGGFDYDSATRILPIVSTSLSGPDALVAGDTATFDLDVRNVGSADASAIVTDATVDANTVTVAGALTELASGQISAAAFDYAIPADESTGLLPVSTTTRWADANGNPYGAVGNTATVEVATPPSLSALMADELHVDADGSGLPSVGDTIKYNVTITNRGATAASAVTFTAPVDSGTTLIANAVTTSAGTITSGNAASDDTVIVDVGSIPAMTSVEITFQVSVNPGTTSMSAQGVVSSAGLEDVVTDDPGSAGLDGPTTTQIIDTPPNLQAVLVGRLEIDTDGDSLIGPGDTVTYVVQVNNSGLTAATNVTATVEPDANTSLVAGSVIGGNVIAGNNPGDTQVIVDIGSIAGLDRATIQYQVTVNDPLPAGTASIVAQGIISSAELADVSTDDPSQTGATDATVLPIVTTTGGGTTGGGTTSSGTWGPAGSFDAVTPADGDIVSSPTAISAEINPPDGTTISEWTVIAYPANGTPDNGLLLASGSGTPPTGDLAEFDPTVVSNGTWIIRIEVTDSSNGVGVSETGVTVEGNLKLGRYAITYQDSFVNVGGVDLQVLRSYDTLERYESNDFGYGWTLDVANFEVSTNKPLGTGPWSAESCGGGLIFVPLCFTPGSDRVVNVTWPNGKVDSFDLRPTGNTFLSILALIKYQPREGTTSTLRPAPGDESGGLDGAGNLAESIFSPGTIYNPQQFILEALDGTEYLLDRDLGLVRATDKNGNTVTYTPDGIISSRGASMLFERDAEDRITKVTEPNGETINYGYDAAGDLVAVTDQNGNLTEFSYETGHFLAVIDDSGPGPFQTMNYGADGRLESITDANGNTTALSVDLGDNTQVITSPDGNLTTITASDDRGNVLTVDEIYGGTSHITTFEYDNNDNVTRRVDGLGNEWSAVYDADDNMTLFTDAEGHISSFFYDDFGFPVQMTDAEGAITSFVYDTADNLVSTTDALGGVESFTYDFKGNLISRSDQLGRTWAYTYDSSGRALTATDPRSNTSSYVYDDNGRLAQSTDPTGASTSYTYDNTGNVATVTDPLSRITQYSYDDRNLLTEMVDPAGNVTAYTHDAIGQLLTRTDPTGRVWSYGYEFYRLVTVTDPDGATTNYNYDATDRLVTEIDPLGRITTHAYDAVDRRISTTYPIGSGASATDMTTFDGNGRMVALTNGENETTTFALDARGRRIGTTDPLNRTTTNGYDLLGNRVSVTNPANDTTTWTYDAASQLVAIEDASGASTQLVYDGAGNIASITDAIGRATIYDHDAVNRQTAATLPSGAVATTIYDPAGQVMSMTSAAGVTTTYSYDPRGMISTITDALGHVTSSAYDAAGRLTATTDARGNTSQYGYDTAGRLTSETDPLGGVVTFTYDLAGQRVGLEDANGSPRSFVYDDGGRLTSATDAGGRTTAVTYDAVGRPIQTTDPRGVTIDRVFDDAGQLTTETGPTEILTYNYDPVGRLIATSDNTGTTNFSLDAIGRPTSVQSPAGNIGYSWNAAGERTTMTQPEGTLSYSYDANGNPATVTDWRNDTATFTYDPDGKPVAIGRANGTDTQHGYDAAGRLIEVEHTRGFDVIEDFDYTLDPNGNRTAMTTGAGSESYTVDALNRITDANYANDTNEAFVYDAAGYRISHTTTDGTTINYDINAAGEIVTDSTGLGYTYDLAGNLTGTSDGDAFAYDDWGNMTSATVDNINQTYAYDAAGIRTGVNGFSQLWDRASGIPTLISAGGGGNYLHGPTGILRDDTNWLLTDALGSVTHLTDTSGNVVDSASYTAFGEPIDVGLSAFGFAGEHRDDTGLIHLRARQYDPARGRFTATDPVQPGASGTTGYNLYAYVGNNPTTLVDPTGLFAPSPAPVKPPVRLPAPTTPSARGGGGGPAGEYAALLTIALVALASLAVLGISIALVFTIVLLQAIFDGGDPVEELEDDNPWKPDPVEVIPAESPFKFLSDASGIPEETLENCVANGRGSRACEGLPEYVIYALFGDPSSPFADLARYRAQEGLPPAQSADDRFTTARLEIDGQVFYGRNAHGMAIDIPVNAQTKTHAEAAVFQQAKNAGATGTQAEMWVDRALCASCGQYGGIGSLLRGTGIDQVIIHAPDGDWLITASRPSTPTRLN